MESLQADAKIIEEQADRKRYEGLSDFLNAFSKGIKTSLIYPPDNPIPREFKKSCWNKLYQYLQEFGRIDFEVHASSFMLNGETIHEVSTREGNLPHVLHRDGFRRLLFKETINQTEWEQFFDDILTVMRAGEDYEDLVNLFWQRDFTNIEYDVVEDFSVAEIEDQFTPPQEQQIEYSEIIDSESQIESRNALDVLLDSSGKELEGFEGEMISSALMANGVKIFRHSKKLKRPRGFFCAIGRCASCNMMVDGVPNVRVCVTPLREGMQVETQKGRGALRP